MAETSPPVSQLDAQVSQFATIICANESPCVIPATRYDVDHRRIRNEVAAVNQYAAGTYAPTANGTTLPDIIDEH